MLKVDGITKDFVPPLSLWRLVAPDPGTGGIIRALDKVSFSITQGSALGILGPNGAGKTTLLKIISTLIAPDAGTVNMGGLALGRDDERIKAFIGFMGPTERSFYWRLSGRQNLEFFAALYGLTGRQTRKRLTELFGLFEIGYQDYRFDSYSTGMQQKFGLMRALLHNPDLLLLDEPTRSMDYAASIALRSFIKDVLVKGHGKTVLFTTHRMDEAADFADKFLVLQKGKNLGFGTIKELRSKAGSVSEDIAQIFIALTSKGSSC